MSTENNDFLLSALEKSSFRSSFYLKNIERTILEEKGIDVIKKHAADIISKRLAPALPQNDGKQTPYKGHPVFVAQHATATCCRKCLLQWHKIPMERELSPSEQTYIVNVIGEWISREK